MKLPAAATSSRTTARGIDPDEVASLFSIARPMVSTKLWRLPTRGALGNGLRVVAGGVLASGGSLTVITRNRRIELRPERDGTTTVVSNEAGRLPARHPRRDQPRHAAGRSQTRSDGRGSPSRCAASPTAGSTSPHWYDAATFHELLYASGDRLVRDLIANLDGCSRREGRRDRQLLPDLGG